MCIRDSTSGYKWIRLFWNTVREHRRSRRKSLRKNARRTRCLIPFLKLLKFFQLRIWKTRFTGKILYPLESRFPSTAHQQPGITTEFTWHFSRRADRDLPLSLIHISNYKSMQTAMVLNTGYRGLKYSPPEIPGHPRSALLRQVLKAAIRMNPDVSYMIWSYFSHYFPLSNCPLCVFLK